jgi:hypothetical protein
VPELDGCEGLIDKSGFRNILSLEDRFTINEWSMGIRFLMKANERFIRWTLGLE